MIQRLCIKICFVCWVGIGLSADAVFAQDEAPYRVFVVDPQQVFAQTRYGQRVTREIAQDVQDVQLENQKIVQDLLDEEKKLTEKRPQMRADDFNVAAEAFHEKAERIRKERLEISQRLEARELEERRIYEQEITPIIQAVMRARGASILQDRNSVFMSLRSVDLTRDIVAAVDSVLGDGSVRIQDLPDINERVDEVGDSLSQQ